MDNLRTVLTEASNKNLHLEHIEDQIFNNGVKGARDSILFLRSLRDMLAGHVNKGVSITTKFDGAPAIFAGINPENGKFFVGTKGIFNALAKLNYTFDDIDKNHGHAPGLAKKLRIALEHLPKLGISGVWQGDMMFTREDFKVEVMEDGKEYLTFQPNTIVYAVPLDSQLARSMQRAHLGVVWHTQYIGSELKDMKATFHVNLHQLNVTPDVWYRDAKFIDASGAATFTQDETVYLTSILAKAGQVFVKLNPAVLNYISQNSNIRDQIKTYNNTKIRSGHGFGNPHDHVLGLISWLTDRLNRAILDAKQVPTRVKRENEKTAYINFYRANFNELVSIFQLYNYIIDAKSFIVSKLQNVRGMGTFLRTDTGFKVTTPEGFVGIDHVGNAIKLVDRMEFSHANFTAAKNWTESLDYEEATKADQQTTGGENACLREGD
jgi:hypothetical protein